MWQQRSAHAAQSQHSHCEGRKRSVWGAVQGISGLPICLPLPCLEPPSFGSWRRRGKLALLASPVCSPPFFHPVPYKRGGDGWKRARMKRPRQGGLFPARSRSPSSRVQWAGEKPPPLDWGRRGSCAGAGRSAEKAPLPERGRGGLLPLPEWGKRGLLPLPERGRRGLLPLPEQGRRWPALPA